MAAFFFVLERGGWSNGQSLSGTSPLYLQATTACLSVIIMMQVANVFICKQRQRGLLATPIFDNKLILSGIVLEILLILAIVYTPWGNVLFGTAPITLEVWLFALPFMAGMVLLEEMRKGVVMRFGLFPFQAKPPRLRQSPKMAGVSLGQNAGRYVKSNYSPPPLKKGD